MKIPNYRQIQDLCSSFLPLQASSWLGRAIQPIQTPLKWLFPFALLGAIFYAASKVYSTFTQKPFPIEQFCKDHNIEFKSPILEKIEEIEENTKVWSDSDGENAWSARIRPLKEYATALEMNQVIKDLNDPTKRIADVFKTFKSFLIGVLKEEELKPLEQAKQTLAIELQCRKPVITFREYLRSVIPPERLSYYQGILPKRGVETLEDIDCLKLRARDQDLEILTAFANVLAKQPFPPIQNACVDFLAKLAKTIQPNELLLLKEDYTRALQELLKTFNPQNISKAAQDFKAFCRLEQQLLLDAYINQYSGHSHWTKLKKSNKHLADLDKTYDPYKLDRHLK